MNEAEYSLYVFLFSLILYIILHIRRFRKLKRVPRWKELGYMAKHIPYTKEEIRAKIDEAKLRENTITIRWFDETLGWLERVMKPVDGLCNFVKSNNELCRIVSKDGYCRHHKPKEQ